jgi:hypothetical protein
VASGHETSPFAEAARGVEPHRAHQLPSPHAAAELGGREDEPARSVELGRLREGQGVCPAGQADLGGAVEDLAALRRGSPLGAARGRDPGGAEGEGIECRLCVSAGGGRVDRARIDGAAAREGEHGERQGGEEGGGAGRGSEGAHGVFRPSVGACSWGRRERGHGLSSGAFTGVSGGRIARAVPAANDALVPGSFARTAGHLSAGAGHLSIARVLLRRIACEMGRRGPRRKLARPLLCAPPGVMPGSLP